MEQRHDIEAREQHPVIGAHGSDEIFLRLGCEHRRDQGIDGGRRAGEIEGASWSALAEPQRARCSLPGEAEAIHEPIIMSKSKCWRRR